MSINYLEDIKSYPATHTFEIEGVWVGVVCDAQNGFVLDAKWHGEGDRDSLDAKLDTWIGQTIESLNLIKTPDDTTV